MKFFKNEKGFTLIDITVALIIILLFMSIISVLFFNLTKNSKGVERESEATYIATNILEAYKAQNYSDIAIGEKTYTDETIEIITGQPITIPQGYTAIISVTNYRPTGENEENDLVKKVVVTVRYKLANDIKEVQLEAYIVRK